MSVQEKAQFHLSNLDKELSKYPALNNFEQQTSVPKVYVVLGLATLYFFLVFFNIAGEFLVNTAGFALPAYYSLDALFSAGTVDDTQWLTYWVVYAFLTVIESAINASYWFPFYYTFKFVLVLYMALPQTKGAQVIFRSLIQPLFARFFNRGTASANLRSTADKVAAKAQKWLDGHGLDVIDMQRSEKLSGVTRRVDGLAHDVGKHIKSIKGFKERMMSFLGENIGLGIMTIRTMQMQRFSRYALF